MQFKRIFVGLASIGATGCVLSYAYSKFFSEVNNKPVKILVPNPNSKIIGNFTYSHDVTIFSATYCRYCNWAKTLCEKNGIHHQVIQLNTHSGIFI